MTRTVKVYHEAREGDGERPAFTRPVQRSGRAWKAIGVAVPLVVGLLIAPALLSAVELAASHPKPNTTNISVSSSVHLRFSDALDPATLEHVRLYEAGGDVAVRVRRATDLTNASITLSPVEFLKAETEYVVTADSQVRSRSGQALKPFRLGFRTGATSFDAGKRLQFTPLTFDESRSMTTIAFGPDRRLYAASAFGELVTWDLDDNGKPIGRTILDQDATKSRQYIDLEWDPRATPDSLMLWVSFAERLAAETDPRRFFTGTISCLEIRGNRVHRETTIVRGLPHGREKQGGHETLPHQPNGLCFHQGKLYQSVGSTSSSGGPANWGLPEQLLSAAILEIDYQSIHSPIDVFPETGFDPDAADAPLRIYATGVRNCLEIVAHSNGRLYTAVNINDRAKPSDGVPDDPDIPGNQNLLVQQTTPDHESLYILERGRHYGFPNPARGQYVLNGGNPTANPDRYEIGDYPVGTQPEAGYAPELMFPLWQWGGTSPNGMIEYRPSFPHPLSETLLCCFYSAGDIAVLTLGSDGLPAAVEKLRSPTDKLPFTGPLDLTQDPATGILYVADFGTQNQFGANGSLVMLTPAIPADAKAK